MPRGDLFPEIGPFETGYLPLSANHVMYWEQVGNPRGRPVLFLHGGPGAGAGAVHRRFFDPEFWRVVIFDQRGAGRSRPLGSLENNTTQDLVSDIETLRRHLGLERWLLFGGSWGSTLALAYAQAYPRAGGRLRAARRVPRPPGRGRLVPARPRSDISRCACRFCRLPAGGGAGRHPRRLSAAADRSRSIRASAGGARMVDLRRLLQHAAAEPGDGQLVRAGPHGAGPCAHRGALLCQQPVPAAGEGCSATCIGSAAFPPRSCRAATT